MAAGSRRSDPITSSSATSAASRYNGRPSSVASNNSINNDFYVSDSHEHYVNSLNRKSYTDKYNTISNAYGMGYRRHRNMTPQIDSQTNVLHNKRCVKRSISLGSLRNNTTTVECSKHEDDENSDSSVIIPVDILAKLESDMLHGNLKRDSFRSRSSTKNFVTNPIFDEMHES